MKLDREAIWEDDLRAMPKRFRGPKWSESNAYLLDMAHHDAIIAVDRYYSWPARAGRAIATGVALGVVLHLLRR